MRLASSFRGIRFNTTRTSKCTLRDAKHSHHTRPSRVLPSVGDTTWLDLPHLPLSRTNPFDDLRESLTVMFDLRVALSSLGGAK